MRKLSLIAAIALTPALAAAQSASLPTAIAKGSKLVSGTAQLSRTSDEAGDAVTSISVAPNVLFFVADRFAVGGEVSLARSSSEGFTSTSWLLGPAVRYFFTTSNVRTLPFIGGSVDIGRSSAESGSSEFKAELFSAEAVAGITRLFNDNVGITADAFVRNAKQEITSPTPGSEATLTAFGVRFGVSAFIR